MNNDYLCRPCIEMRTAPRHSSSYIQPASQPKTKSTDDQRPNARGLHSGHFPARAREYEKSEASSRQPFTKHAFKANAAKRTISPIE
jgi:hypothetical protein